MVIDYDHELTSQNEFSWRQYSPWMMQSWHTLCWHLWLQNHTHYTDFWSHCQAQWEKSQI